MERLLSMIKIIKEEIEIDESLVKEGFVNIINYHVPYHWGEFSKIGFDIHRKPLLPPAVSARFWNWKGKMKGSRLS